MTVVDESVERPATEMLGLFEGSRGCQSLPGYKLTPVRNVRS